ncbi:MAG: mechanosensitive ion channel domain-containing protein [Abditibacteriaceae bacterium]
MAWEAVWSSLRQNFALPSLVLRAVYIIFIAIAIELMAWWLGRVIEKAVTPYIAIDAGRPAAWRVRRRTTLRQSPKWMLRAVLYTIGMILIFDVFGVPVLPLSLAVGAVVVIMGAGFAPIFRDVVQGYVLLAEDAIAPGDSVEINGHVGTVEKLTLRGVWLRGHNGHLHLLSNRAVSDVAIYSRVVEAPPRDFPEHKVAKNPPVDPPSNAR